MSLGAPELMVILLMFVPLVLGIWVAVDAASLPDAAFQQAGTSKVLWIVLPIVGIFFCVLGIIVAILWFAVFRGRVRAAAPGL